MIKQRLCTAITLLLLSGLAVAAEPTPAAQHSGSHGVILLYHHVSTETPAITSIDPDTFKQQMRFLADHRFIVWPLPQLINALNRGETIPDKVVAITFDDNYESVYHTAFPILKRYQWPFTVFVSTDSVDHKINMQANWDQVREMAAHGATIANHSASHAHLLQKLPGENSARWRARIRRDIQKAQRRIQEETDQNHALFAYPYGEFNAELAALVAEMGFTGIGQQSGPVAPHYAGDALPRFPFGGNYRDMDDFALKVLTLPLPVASVSAEDSPLAFARTQPTLQLTLSPGDYRRQALQCYGSGQGKLALQWHQAQLTVTPPKPIPLGRSRYNCTLPTGSSSDGVARYYWFSHPWIRTTREGEFID